MVTSFSFCEQSKEQIKELGQRFDLMANVAAEAVALFKAKRFADSLPLFNEHIQKYANEKIGYCNRAQVHIEMNNFDAALNDAEQCLALDPSYAKAYKRKADALIGLHKRREAMDVLLDASKLLQHMGASYDLLTETMMKLNQELGGYVENLQFDKPRSAAHSRARHAACASKCAIVPPSTWKPTSTCTAACVKT